MNLEHDFSQHSTASAQHATGYSQSGTARRSIHTAQFVGYGRCCQGNYRAHMRIPDATTTPPSLIGRNTLSPRSGKSGSDWQPKNFSGPERQPARLSDQLQSPKPIVVKGYIRCCQGIYRAHMRIPDATQLRTAQHSTAQHSTAQHSTAQHMPHLFSIGVGIVLQQLLSNVRMAFS